MHRRIVTIHHHYKLGRAGFESSQQTRMKLAKLNDFDYLHLITSPQPSDYLNRFESIGFNYGSIVSLDRFVMQTDARFLNDYRVEYYSDSGLKIGEAFYDFDLEYSNVESWIYLKDGEMFTEEDLVVKYLSKNAKDSDVIFRDDSRIQMPKLRRFAEFRKIRYYEIIHHSVLTDGYLSTLSKKINYLVANERLAKELADLGFRSEFLPPMCVDEETLKPRKLSSIKRYVWSAHLGDYKNFGQALRVMKRLKESNIRLDVYGGTQEDFDRFYEQYGRPSNVKYHGLVAEVPYRFYDGYLSTSRHELFANACIEAMSNGLKCITSDLKYPYQDYEIGTNGSLSIAKSDDEFVNLIKEFKSSEFDSTDQIEFIKRYSYQRWAPLFKELISN